mgnify:CR=1 FL=1
MTAGLVFNLQRFSLQDGPGLRSTVFLKGCPLACAWCHNPESRAAGPQVLRLESRCMVCGRCSIGAAPGPEDAEACPTSALQVAGREWTAEDLAETLLRDRIFFDESGGGVTFSGGEPLAQPGFLCEALERLRAEAVHTALDTCGHAPWEDLQAAAARADLVLYDLKLMDEDRHQRATGVSNQTILDNLRALAAVHDRIWIRVPVVPGINDDAANLDATADFLAPLAGVRRVDLLPYHPTGEAKHGRVGLPCASFASPEPAAMEGAAARFRARGLDTRIGGRP